MNRRDLPEATYTGDGVNTKLAAEGITVRADGGHAARQKKFKDLYESLGFESGTQFRASLTGNGCKLEDFDTYLDALTLADENPDESLDDLIEQLNTTKISGGGMRQVGGSLVGLLALHIKIFKSQNFANFSRLSLGASVLLLQNTIELLNSLDECFVYYGGELLKKIFDWLMTVCKYLYDNRADIKDGAETAARAVGPAMKKGAYVGADVLIATPRVLLDILIGVDALGMKFATWYNPPDNGLKEIMAAVRERNQAHHKRMDELAAEQGEEATRATNKTMKLQSENFNDQQKVDSMNAIKAAKNAAGVVHAQLTEENARLKHQFVMDQVKDNGKGKTGVSKVSSRKPGKYRPRFPHTGTGRVPHAKGGPPSAGAGMELYGDSESEYDGLDKGGKRATRKRGKRSSKRGSRKTKTTRKKTTRKKRRGKK